MSWSRKRYKPYTEIGIRRVPCIRCGEKSIHQFNICADGNSYRPVCQRCDIELNRVVLTFLRHPNVEAVMREYTVESNDE